MIWGYHHLRKHPCVETARYTLNYIPPKLYVPYTLGKRKNTWNATTEVWKMIFIRQMGKFWVPAVNLQGGGVIWKTKPGCWEDVFSCLNREIFIFHVSFLSGNSGSHIFSPRHPLVDSSGKAIPDSERKIALVEDGKRDIFKSHYRGHYIWTWLTLKQGKMFH